MIQKNPFASYKSISVNKDVVYLNSQELKSLEIHPIVQPRLNLVRNLFVFCCYTGLPYYEMSTLSARNIEYGFDKNLWLIIDRKKTNKSYRVPLLPKAIEIMREYKREEEGLYFQN